MKNTKRKEIRNKIFTKENIRNLWKKIKLETDNPQNLSLEIETDSIDGNCYESKEDDLLQDGNIIDCKKISTISITYSDYKLERRIKLDLSHGNRGSRLSVSGHKNWVVEVFDSLNDVIESAKSQDHWFIKYKTLILYAGTLMFAFISIRFMSYFMGYNAKEVLNSREGKEIVLFLSVISSLLFGFSGFWPLHAWILTLWPSVEFDFGPEHKKIEKNRRKKLSLILSAIIVPLLLTFFYDLLKYLAKTGS